MAKPTAREKHSLQHAGCEFAASRGINLYLIDAPNEGKG
jgi:hypothetical protein